MPFQEPKRFRIKDLSRRWGMSEEDVCEQIRSGHFQKLIVYDVGGGGRTQVYFIYPGMPSSMGFISRGSIPVILPEETMVGVNVNFIHSILGFPWPGEGKTLYIPQEEVKAFEKKHGIEPIQVASSPTRTREPSKKFPTPLGTTWYQVSIQFISNEEAKVSVGELTKIYMFYEMGFKDHKKRDQPDSLWRILQTVFGRNNGEVSWTTDRVDPGARTNLKTHVKQLRRRLRDFFGIEDDPFEPYRRVKAYKTKFRILDESHH